MSGALVIDPTPLFATATLPALRMSPRPGCLSEAEVVALATTTLRGLAAEPAALVTALAHCWHDHFDASHALCQSREGRRDADYVHAILHRREGDAGNAGYWFARVGVHPVYAEVAAAATAAGLGAFAPQGQWDAKAFIAATLEPGADHERLQALQAEELRAFARWLCREATAG
jgi:hypothetical protein